MQIPHLLITQTYQHEKDEGTKYIYVEKYNSQPLQLGEGQAMGWFFPDETKLLKMIERDRTIVLHIRDYLDSLN